jgi:hypothetical protein
MRTAFGTVAAALVAALGLSGAPGQEDVAVKPQSPASAPQVRLEGVDRYRVCEPLFECVRVVLAKRGETYSPEYVQGISGAAFRIGGICPCAPTCSSAMQTEALVELLGYKARRMNLDDKGAVKVRDLADAMQANGKVLPDEAALANPELRELRRELLAIIDAIKAEVRVGRPAIVWHAFTNAEYAGAELAGAPQTRTLTSVYVGGPPGAILVGEKVGTFDAPKAEVAALQEAVRHAHCRENCDQIGGEKWVFLEGLAAYGRWVDHFRDPAAKRGLGDAYCYGIYRETHRAAAGFLREIAPKHAPAQALLLAAASHFEAEADTLKGAEALLWWKSPEGPDAARNQRAAEVLAKARAEYAAGIETIGKALVALGKPVEVTP